MARGFTILELLIVIGISAVLLAVGALNLFNYRQRQNLELAVGGIVSTLRIAQNNSISQDSITPGSNEIWGTHFENETDPAKDFYSLFRGTSYPSAVQASKRELDSAIQFNDLRGGTSGSQSDIDVKFSPLTGFADDSYAIIVGLKNNPAVSSTIIVENSGRIRY